jgi:hypothetical protein
MSAFGGFAVIDSQVFNKVRWSAEIDCDHKNMCFDISKMGDIYIMPSSRVFAPIDLSRINMKQCEKTGKDQRETFLKYFSD